MNPIRLNPSAFPLFLGFVLHNFLARSIFNQKKARKTYLDLEWNIVSWIENINMEVQESLNFMVFLTDVSGSS